MGKEKGNVSTAEENKAIFRRYAEEVGNQHNFEIVDEIFERYIAHQPDGSTLQRGPQDVKRFTREFHSAFSDFHISIEDQIAEGDKMVSRFTIRGTHQGDFRGMAPTGKEIEIKGVTTFRFSPEGKVVETWDSYDQLSLMRQSTEQELRLARSIQQASLPKEVPTLEGWQISPITNQRGGRRFLRLPSSLGGPAWSRGRRRHGQGRPSGVGHVHHLRHAASWSPELLFTRADAPTSQ
jgi:predicted ester cyclase